MRTLLIFLSIYLSGIVVIMTGHAQEAVSSKESAISAKQLVVMIDGRFPTTGELTEGAGIVVGRKGGLVYIATAGHVVQGFSETAIDIMVQFQDRPGEEVAATLWPSNLDKGIDLAILVVPEDRAPETITSVKELSAARLSQEVKEGEGAYLFGQPSGRVWSGNKRPEKVVTSTLTSIEIESNSVVPGMSGGATFDEGLRLVGLIIETENGLARIIPMRLLKETLERAGYPFDLTDAEAQRIDFLNNTERLKTLRALGIAFNEDGYLDAIKKNKIEALEIFHREVPFFNAESFYEWVEQNQSGFDLTERNNIAKYVGKFDIPHISLVKTKIGQQVSFISGFLKEARMSGLNISKLCREFNELEPLLIGAPTKACLDGEDIGLWLLALYEIAENYGSDEVELEDYGIYSYIPTWFMQGKAPENIQKISFPHTATSSNVPQCGYSLANTRFTVWENEYVIIPDSGKAIYPRNGRYVKSNIGTDSKICFSFFYDGLKKSQHVQCRGEVLLYRYCSSDTVNWIGVRNHLLSDVESAKRISNLQYVGKLTNQAWRASDYLAGVWASKNNNKAILYLSCKGNYIFALSSLSRLFGALPNRVTVKFDFGREVYETEFVGQSDASGLVESDYVAFFTRQLAGALAGSYTSVKISLEGKEIGILPLRDSSWAINKGLAGCLAS